MNVTLAAQSAGGGGGRVNEIAHLRVPKAKIDCLWPLCCLMEVNDHNVSRFLRISSNPAVAAATTNHSLISKETQ